MEIRPIFCELYVRTDIFCCNTSETLRCSYIFFATAALLTANDNELKLTQWQNLLLTPLSFDRTSKHYRCAGHSKFSAPFVTLENRQPLVDTKRLRNLFNEQNYQTMGNGGNHFRWSLFHKMKGYYNYKKILKQKLMDYWRMPIKLRQEKLGRGSLIVMLIHIYIKNILLWLLWSQWNKFLE